MPSPGVERRLAAILAADVAGYSRLMELDEEGTLLALKGHREALVDPTIARHSGRLVKTTGDGLLVGFASAVHAVQCAIELQRGMTVRNAGVGADKRIEFRMGINIGDVIEDGGCISRQALDLVEGKADLACRTLGRQHLKNIARPVEVHEIDLHGEGSLATRVLARSELRQEVRYYAWASDMETVGDAAGLERFALLGLSRGCAVSTPMRQGIPTASRT